MVTRAERLQETIRRAQCGRGYGEEVMARKRSLDTGQMWVADGCGDLGGLIFIFEIIVRIKVDEKDFFIAIKSRADATLMQSGAVYVFNEKGESEDATGAVWFRLRKKSKAKPRFLDAVSRDEARDDQS